MYVRGSGKTCGKIYNSTVFFTILSLSLSRNQIVDFDFCMFDAVDAGCVGIEKVKPLYSMRSLSIWRTASLHFCVALS